jgi:hypothetical protein
MQKTVLRTFAVLLVLALGGTLIEGTFVKPCQGK